MTLSWMTQTSRRGNAKKLTCQLALLAGYIAAATARTLLIVAKCQFSLPTWHCIACCCACCAVLLRDSGPQEPPVLRQPEEQCASVSWLKRLAQHRM